MRTPTIPASERQCDCCGRTHRNLKLVVGGFWLGKDCANAYELFRSYPNAGHFVWRGYEQQHKNVSRMIGK